MELKNTICLNTLKNDIKTNVEIISKCSFFSLYIPLTCLVRPTLACTVCLVYNSHCDIALISFIIFITGIVTYCNLYCTFMYSEKEVQ